jgi:FkbM family methyltransferase
MILNIQNLFKKYNTNVTGVIHVGAHYGEEVKDYIDVGATNIMLFEPLKQNFDQLKKNILNIPSNIHIRKYCTALGNSNKTIQMYLASNSLESSSILEPKYHLIQHPDISFNGVEEVELNQLDDFNCTGYNFLNVDVQGYELEVLKGAKNTLKHIDYIYCEVNRGEVYEDNALVYEVDKFLSLYNMQRVETNWWNNADWGDAFYIKK